MKVLIVCLGNICRSPMAQGILQHLADEAGLAWEIDSAGTSGWHAGEAPDRRAIATSKRNGIDISGQRARQFRPSDFEEFDLILTMDDSNYDEVIRHAPGETARSKVRRIMDFSPDGQVEVPDPYYDGRFEEVYTLLSEVGKHVISSMTSNADNAK